MLGIRKVLLTLSLLAVMVMASGSSFAAIIGPQVEFRFLNIASDDAIAQVGDEFAVDLFVNYTSGAGSVLTDLNFSLQFDQGDKDLLTFKTVDSNLPGSFGGTLSTDGNAVNIETSSFFVPSGTVADPFVTLYFEAVAPGAGNFDILTETVNFSTFGPQSDESIDYVADFDGSYQVVPVPAAVWLLGSGIVGLAFIRRRKN